MLGEYPLVNAHTSIDLTDLSLYAIDFIFDVGDLLLEDIDIALDIIDLGFQAADVTGQPAELAVDQAELVQDLVGPLPGHRLQVCHPDFQPADPGVGLRFQRHHVLTEMPGIPLQLEKTAFEKLHEQHPFSPAALPWFE
ncbi:hypothetical protein [Nocardia sp. alder85J]|uniref:hypothetical protein n=1 Tax=Nocardia sp. alder85J TaxID=2862949 RepID=UPI001CD4F69E|nr:hypothetical protein [Nocardia sp. alder85J]MCX4095282.1 hypothetical protein [Nocardia sp. alder85J]